MNEEAAAAWLKAQEVLDQTEELLHERAGQPSASQWTPPAPQPAPVQRQRQATQRPKPEPAPPVASEYTRPRHDATGRIVEVEKFQGTAAMAAKSWEAWTRTLIAQKIEAFAAAFGAGIGELENEFGEKRRIRFEAIERRLAELEARLAALEPQPMEVRDAAD